MSDELTTWTVPRCTFLKIRIGPALFSKSKFKRYARTWYGILPSVLVYGIQSILNTVLLDVYMKYKNEAPAH